MKLLGEIIPDLRWDSEGKDVLRVPLSINWNAAFALEPETMITITALSSKRLLDSADVLQLTLSINGQALKQKEPSAWFRRSRDWINRAFLEVTDKRLQTEIWKRCRESNKKKKQTC